MTLLVLEDMKKSAMRLLHTPSHPTAVLAFRLRYCNINIKGVFLQHFFYVGRQECQPEAMKQYG